MKKLKKLMEKEDLADFISGERSSIETVIGNLNLIVCDPDVSDMVVYWLNKLSIINIQMAKTCENLRKK